MYIMDCENLNKELNPITKKCVKKCQLGYSRKTVKGKSKCVKDAPLNVRLIKGPYEACPDGKEHSTRSMRCVKKCKPGMVRHNTTGKCITAKKTKQKNLKILYAANSKAQTNPIDYASSSAIKQMDKTPVLDPFIKDYSTNGTVISSHKSNGQHSRSHGRSHSHHSKKTSSSIFDLFKIRTNSQRSRSRKHSRSRS